MTSLNVESEQGRTVADAPPKCCEVGCEAVATMAYAWDWGASGVVCSAHAAALSQLQESLSRRVSLSPLVKAGPAPLGRDERIQLTARSMVLEAELVEAKDRGLALYRENVALASQVQRHTVLAREAEAQLRDAGAKIAILEDEVMSRERQLGELVAEVERLRVVAKFVERNEEHGPPTPH